jgi:hypothetical protein
MKSFATYSVAAIALMASSLSFAEPAHHFGNPSYPPEAPFVSQTTREAVQAQALINRLPAGEAVGFEATPAQPAASSLTREQVRKEAMEYARSHKRELGELA